MKYNILKLLRERGDFISGEEMAKYFNVSRTVIWKNIRKLRSEGYSIDSVSNRGYCLRGGDDLLNIGEIDYDNTIFLESVDSTNEECKRQSLKCRDRLLVVCNNQNAGKGRLGKSWLSGQNQNLCMSLLLRPDITPLKAPQLTLLAGLACCQVINRHTGLDSKIKWPNDVVVNGKKLVGILTELSAEVDRVINVIVGIGINVNNEGFQPEIEEKATSLFLELGVKYRRSAIIMPIINEFLKYYDEFCEHGFEPFRESYNELCVNVNRKVKTYGRENIEGMCLGVNDRGSLLVSVGDGIVHEIFTGEVSVRGVDDKYI